MAVGDMNTFLNSWADYLETETLPMSKFNTGAKLASFPFTLPFLSPPSKRLFPVCCSGLGGRAIGQTSLRFSNKGTQTTFLKFALMLRKA